MMEKLVKAKKPTEEELIHSTFNTLRTEQRQLATKLSEIELDLNEHRLINFLCQIIILYFIKNHFFICYSIVIDTLSKLDGNRKCFRLIGGVLVERNICDVLPTLIKNRGEVSSYIINIIIPHKIFITFKGATNLKIKSTPNIS